MVKSTYGPNEKNVSPFLSSAIAFTIACASEVPEDVDKESILSSEISVKEPSSKIAFLSMSVLTAPSVKTRISLAILEAMTLTTSSSPSPKLRTISIMPVWGSTYIPSAYSENSLEK